MTFAKRGERRYFEFYLEKSKQFQRIGPLTLSLPKANTKHTSFDMQLIVDDNQLTKNKVYLYEPIWIQTENESQPVQVVVNRIEKNRAHGYVNAPKHKPSLADASAAAPTPVAAHPGSECTESQTAGTVENESSTRLRGLCFPRTNLPLLITGRRFIGGRSCPIANFSFIRYRRTRSGWDRSASSRLVCGLSAREMSVFKLATAPRGIRRGLSLWIQDSKTSLQSSHQARENQFCLSALSKTCG